MKFLKNEIEIIDGLDFKASNTLKILIIEIR